MSNTITLKKVIFEGDFSTAPTCDTAKIAFACSTGLGNPTIGSAEVTVSGRVATVVLTMNRTLLAGEVFSYTLTAGWLYNSTGFSAPAASGSYVYNQSTGIAATGQTSVLFNGVTVSWTPAADVRFTFGGIEITDPGSGVAVSWSPAETTDGGGRVYNAAVKNPRLRSDQGWDERPDASGDGLYDAAITASAPVSLVAGDSLVIERGAADPTAKGTARPQYPLDFISVYVRSATATDRNLQLPTVVRGVVHSGSSRTQYSVDFDTLAASFPRFPGANVATPPFSVLVDAVSRFPAAQAALIPFERGGGDSNSKRDMVPQAFTPDDYDGYSENLSITTGVAGCALLLDTFSTAQKARLAAHLYTLGQNIYETYAESAQLYFGSGGHGQGMYLPCMLYLYWSGQTAKIADLASDVGCSEIVQTYKIDATMQNYLYQPQTRGTDRPWLTWRKIVRSGSTNTSLILGATTGTALDTAEAGLTGPRYQYTGSEMILLEREDGTPVNASLGTVTYPVTYGGAQQPFAVTNPDTVTVNVGDVVYMRPAWGEPQIGDYHWRIQGDPTLGGAPDGHKANCPLAVADYLEECNFIGAHLALSGLGIWTNDHAFRGWMIRGLNSLSGGNPNWTQGMQTLSWKDGGETYAAIQNMRTQNRARCEAVASLLD